MNRVIKFRAWDLDGKKMKPPKLQTTDVLYAQPRHINMQFTGLLDKNGKEIYEGDVVEYTNGFGEKVDAHGKPMKYAVHFDDGSFLLEEVLLSVYLPDEACEVIGNIYENPELLTEEV